jgi:hypothetical protein
MPRQRISRLDGRCRQRDRQMASAARRPTRLTNTVSKKIKNLRAAVPLPFAYYNSTRMSASLCLTPMMMEAGVSDRR